MFLELLVLNFGGVLKFILVLEARFVEGGFSSRIMPEYAILRDTRIYADFAIEFELTLYPAKRGNIKVL